MLELHLRPRLHHEQAAVGREAALHVLVAAAERGLGAGAKWGVGFGGLQRLVDRSVAKYGRGGRGGVAIRERVDKISDSVN